MQPIRLPLKPAPRAAALLVLAVALAGASVAIRRAGESASHAAAQNQPFSEHAWPTGSRTTYHVAWKTNASASVEGAREGALETSFDLDGDLRIDAYERRREGLVLGLRWIQFNRAVAYALAKPVAPDGALAAQLREAESVIVVESGGRVRELGFSASSTPLARFVLRAVVLDLTAELAAATGSLDVVDTAVGRVRVERQSAPTTTTPAMTRRSRYDELDAFPLGLEGAIAELDSRGEVLRRPEGGFARIASRESLAMEASGRMLSSYRSVSSLEATLAGRVQADLTLPAYIPSTVRTTLDAGYDRHASLERRSLGVTQETLRSDVRSAALFPRGGSTQWIWRDAAYLELHPDEAASVIDFAAKGDLNMLAAAFDIVVIAGTDQGQVALVRAFEGPSAESEDAFVVLVQRLAFLARPSADLVAFVARERVRFRGSDRGHAAAYSLGALTHQVASFDLGMAESIARDLTRDLESATSTPDRVALLAALGNAGLASAAPTVVANARDQDVAIRREVASALRKIEASVVVDALLELVVDSESQVASLAIDSLLRKQLSDEDWSALARHASSGHVPAEAHASLVASLARRRGEGPQPEAVLVAMAASDHVAPDVKQRIEAVLAQ